MVAEIAGLAKSSVPENPESSGTTFHQYLRDLIKSHGYSLIRLANDLKPSPHSTFDQRTLWGWNEKAEESTVERVIETLAKLVWWNDAYAAELRARAARQRAVYAAAPKKKPRALVTVPKQAWYGDLVAAEPAPVATSEADAAPSIAEGAPAGAHVGMDRPDINVTAIDSFAPPVLYGREESLDELEVAWQRALVNAPGRASIVTIVGVGGEGKSSLAAVFIDRLRQRGWPGCVSVFGFSFYAQGTTAGSNLSSGTFFTEALAHFERTAESPVPWPDDESGKAKRLLELLNQPGRLLILDGLEPLQTPATSASAGQITNVPLATFLTGAGSPGSRGLCVVTTRHAIANLLAYEHTSAPQLRLGPLTPASSKDLLRSMQSRSGLCIHGPDEDFTRLAEELRGHALTVSLMGSYLLRAHAGDIQKRDQVDLKRADGAVVTSAAVRFGHAFRVMEAYVDWFERSGPRGEAALTLLRLIGLFDRPATLPCLMALLGSTRIAGLTDALVDPSPATLNLVCEDLADARLITLLRTESQDRRLVAIDAHPLVREFFADQLRRENKKAWIEANKRLYSLLAATEVRERPESLTELEPLYQAVMHGCRAGLHQQVFEDVFLAKISRKKDQLSTSVFGALYHDLAALAQFFDSPWLRPSRKLDLVARAEVASLAGFRLRTIGRYDDAAPLMRQALRFYQSARDWASAADAAGNLSVLHLLAGELPLALRHAALARDHALRNARRRFVSAKEQQAAKQLLSGRWATVGDALIQLGPGRWPQAHHAFERAEALQKEADPKRPQLFSSRGYRLHELLLDEGRFDEVIERTAATRDWKTDANRLLDPGLNMLMAGRAYLARHRALATGADEANAHRLLEQALKTLRESGFQDAIVRALLAEADLLSLNLPTHHGRIRAHLDEAMQIAQRGPMQLLIADIYLLRARLFRPRHGALWDTSGAAADLARARELITRLGYGRRAHDAAEVGALF